MKRGGGTSARREGEWAARKLPRCFRWRIYRRACGRSRITHAHPHACADAGRPKPGGARRAGTGRRRRRDAPRLETRPECPSKCTQMTIEQPVIREEAKERGKIKIGRENKNGGNIHMTYTRESVIFLFLYFSCSSTILRSCQRRSFFSRFCLLYSLGFQNFFFLLGSQPFVRGTKWRSAH